MICTPNFEAENSGKNFLFSYIVCSCSTQPGTQLFTNANCFTGRQRRRHSALMTHVGTAYAKNRRCM